MKYTNGKKADFSAFPFKIEAPSATSDSPAKLDAGSGMAAGSGLGAGIGTFLLPGLGTVAGAGIGAGIGAITGGIAQRVKTNKEYKQYKDARLKGVEAYYQNPTLKNSLKRAFKSLNIILEVLNEKNANIIKTFNLAERHYGNLTSLNKDEIIKIDAIGFPDKDMRVTDSMGRIWYLDFCDVALID